MAVGVTLLVTGHGVVAYALVLLLGASVGFVVNAAYLSTQHLGRPRLSFSLVRELLRKGLPFFLVESISQVFQWTDVATLRILTSDAVVGWYGAAIQLYATLNVVPLHPYPRSPSHVEPPPQGRERRAGAAHQDRYHSDLSDGSTPGRSSSHPFRADHRLPALPGRIRALGTASRYSRNEPAFDRRADAHWNNGRRCGPAGRLGPPGGGSSSAEISLLS